MWIWAVPVYSHMSAMAAQRHFDFGCTALGMRRSVGVSVALFNDSILHLPPTSFNKHGAFGFSLELSHLKPRKNLWCS